MRALRNLGSAGDGATIVEFAIIAPVFFMLLLGIFDIGHSIYVRSVLQGAVQDAGRDAGIEGANKKVTDIDNYVENQVGTLVPDGKFTFKRLNYWEFDDVGVEEDYIDANGNGEYDDNECFFDANDNDRWDDQGKAGIGGAKDIVYYTATVEYNHYFPLWSFIGGSEKAKIAASTTLRNQPYGSQAARTVEKICP